MALGIFAHVVWCSIVGEDVDDEWRAWWVVGGVSGGNPGLSRARQSRILGFDHVVVAIRFRDAGNGY